MATATATKTKTSKANTNVSEALEALEQAIEDITRDGAFENYLNLLARMHRYSWGNALLILRQCPEATVIAGYRVWQSMGRQVRKGEKAIRILAPAGHARYVTVNEDGEEEERQGRMRFRAAAVFDISQTDPLEGTEDANAAAVQPVVLTGEDAITAELERAMNEFLTGAGVTVQTGNTGGSLGWYRPNDQTIRIATHLTGNARLKTLIHEAAHWRAGHTSGLDAATIETVAEASAYVVMRHYGIDTTGYSAPYIAQWAGDTKALKRNLAAIQQTASALIDATVELLIPDA